MLIVTLSTIILVRTKYTQLLLENIIFIFS